MTITGQGERRGLCLFVFFILCQCLHFPIAAQEKYTVAPADNGEPDLIKVNGHLAHASRFIARLRPEDARENQFQLTDTVAASVKTRLRYDAQVVVLDTTLTPTADANNPNQAPLDELDAYRTRFNALQESNLYDYVEPDYLLEASAVPNDQFFADGLLWGLQNGGQNGGTVGADINAVNAWDVTTGSPGVIVAVVDSGIRPTHQDLSANMWQNPNETPGNGVDDDGNGFIDDVFGINAINNSGDPNDDNGHGTQVAGVIGAVANGGGAHVGVAWVVQLMGLKFLSSSGTGFTSHAAVCIDYAVAHGADIINGSFGGSSFSQSLSNAITAAQQAGVLFVAAAGNSAVNIDQTPQFPAAFTHDNIITVAAIDRADQLASFSNTGVTGVDIAAPGVEIVTTSNASDSSFVTTNGTSFAAPMVAGVAALIKAQFPSIGLQELRSRILTSAVTTPALTGQVASNGRVDAFGALTANGDGDLEFAVTHTPTTAVAGRDLNVFVTLTDLVAVTGATVNASFAAAGGSAAASTTVPLLDTGVSPDTTANDGVYSGTLVVPTDGPTATLNITAQHPSKNPGNTSQIVNVVFPPSNDDFANRTTLSTGSTQTTGNNRHADLESGEPRHPLSTTVGTTVWWHWQPTTTGAATFDTIGSNFDTVLAIYRGASLAHLELVAANDDFTGSTRSRVRFLARGGENYHIQVGGFGGAQGDIVMNHPEVIASAGHARIILPPGPAHTPEDGTTVLFADATGSGPLSFQWFKDGTAVTGATGASHTLATTIPSDAGQYTVQVQNALGTETSAPVNIAVTPTGNTPGNDSFSNATTLAGLTGTAAGHNTNATSETDEPNHANTSSPNRSVWWSWTAPSSGLAEFNTFGSSFDTSLAAYTGASIGALTEQAANDNAAIDPNFRQSRIRFPATEGVTYLIAVAGNAGNSGSIQMHYHLTTTPLSPLTNGGFESEDLTGWTLTDFTQPGQAANVFLQGAQIEPSIAASNTTARDGHFIFGHGFSAGSPSTLSLNQNLSLPTANLSLLLHYRAGWSFSTSTPPTQPRTFSVVVTPQAGGTPLVSQVMLDTGLASNNDTGLQTALVPLGNQAGADITLQLEWNVPEANTGAAFFELDNLQIIDGCTTLPGITFSVASDATTLTQGDHFHSTPTNAEVGRFEMEALRGFSEFNLAGANPASKATLKFDVLHAGGTTGGVNDSPFQGTITLEAYTPNTPITADLAEFAAPALSQIGTLDTSTLTESSTLEFDITTLYNQQVAGSQTAVGVRLSATPLPPASGGAWTFHHFSLVVDTRVTFADSALEQAIRTAQSLSTGQIKSSHLSTLTTLDVANLGITSLSGIELATELTQLNLTGNDVTDITPLTNLAKLTDGTSAGLQLENNLLDIAPGSSQRQLIDSLNQRSGLTVTFRPQRIIDTDSDLLDDRFEQRIIDFATGDSFNTLADVLPGDDFDGDSQSNRAEFLRFTDATNDMDFRLPGDIDQDGQVTVLDLVRLLDHLQVSGTPIGADSVSLADTDLDGVIDQTDRSALISRIVSP